MLNLSQQLRRMGRAERNPSRRIDGFRRPAERRPTHPTGALCRPLSRIGTLASYCKLWGRGPGGPGSSCTPVPTRRPCQVGPTSLVRAFRQSTCKAGGVDCPLVASSVDLVCCNNWKRIFPTGAARCSVGPVVQHSGSNPSRRHLSAPSPAVEGGRHVISIILPCSA
ncbi:hypothetical protein D9M70_528870 [compost metagenome]